ncbi:hypothetical protein EAI30_14895 [Romboutsia ilealis]|uniref:ABC transporter permease n=1 Tax=Romboutsia faecis TaxID=2764597 RepID=A0ABR7JJT4_9FIRM|nr:hypothetical protein [Romboutsia faecis]MBC5995186.1 hypothetical protein [Romboutsia faecis]MRN25904.1 hypothetical protein [Romboutsia ilealis]
MKNFLILRILDLFKGIYTKLGVDYNIMRLIIQAKLTLDCRRVPTISEASVEGNEKNYFYSSLFVYSILGVTFLPIILMSIDPRIKMSIYFSCFMILLLTVLISDFSSVILDVNDKDIIGIRGVQPRTLNAAKTTHIFIYIFMLSLAISGFSLLASLRFGMKYFLLLFLSIVLVDILMIIITAIMYLIILKLFKGEKLKDMLNIFQICFLLLFTIGYQFIARSFDFMHTDIVYDQSWWNVLFIPMWFSSNFSIIDGKSLDSIGIVLSILSIVVPIISLVVYKKLVPVFEKNLQKLNDNTYKSKEKKEKFSIKVSKLICRDKEERAIFNFVYNILDKDRDFKTKVYPSLALGVFMPIIIIFTSYDNSGIINYLKEIRESYLYLSGYLGIVIIQNIITMVQYSNEFEGAWIYEILPIKNIRNIYTGMFKGSIYKLYFPSFILLSIVFILIFKIEVIKHLTVLFLSGVFVSMVSFKLNEKHLPFSKPYNVGTSSKNIIVVLKSMITTVILVGIHFWIILMNINVLIYIYALILIGIIKISWNSIFTVRKSS